MRQIVFPFAFLLPILLVSTDPASAQVGSCSGQTDGTPCETDEIPCTTVGFCLAGLCMGQNPLPDGLPCDDGLFCNGDDTCLSLMCSEHAGDPCPGPDGDGNCSETCDEESDTCNAEDPNGTSCDDGNECTSGDTCSSGTCSLSVAEPDGTPCTSDGLFCTGVEACQGGTCMSPGDPCAGAVGGAGTCGQACDEAGDACNAVVEWGLTLMLGRSFVVQGDLQLSWSADCLAAADYAVYEGMLGDFSSHVPAGMPPCTTGGATTTTLMPDPADSYYLVVPLDPPAASEGSYGFASDWTPRPQSLSPCEPFAECACSSAPSKTVFVSSVTYDGDLGGLAGADAKCQSLADDAGLGGTFKAWMSDLTESAADRLTHSAVPYVRTDGQPIADNWADLTDNPNTDPLYAPINVDENGVAVPNGFVWTASIFNGSTVVNAQCSNWTDDGTSGSSGWVGRSNRVGQGWTGFGTIACGSLSRLYCFEQ